MGLVVWAKLGSPLATAGGGFQGRRVGVGRSLVWHLGQGTVIGRDMEGRAGQCATMAKESMEFRAEMVGDGTSLGMCRPRAPLKGFKQAWVCPADLEEQTWQLSFALRSPTALGLPHGPATYTGIWPWVKVKD